MKRTTRRSATATATLGLAATGALFLAPAANAAPVFVSCSGVTAPSSYSASCTRDTADGDAGGVSGAVRLTNDRSGAYARAEFQAKGELLHVSNVHSDRGAKFTVYTKRGGSWSVERSVTLLSGVSGQVNLAIAENTPVYVKACVNNIGCARVTKLIA